MKGSVLLLVAISFFLIFLSGVAFWGATQYSYLADNVWAAHGLLTATCWFFFLLGSAFAVVSSTDREGKLSAPKSLAALICWALLIPHAGFAIGGISNYHSSLEMMSALSKSHGTRAHFAGNGWAILDGPIGSSTFLSLSEQYAEYDIEFLELISGGGLIEEAINIGLFLREKGIATYVRNSCESACVIIALYGSTVYVSPNAQFGFHRGSVVASPNSQMGRFLGSAATIAYISQLEILGVPEYILRKAEQTPAEDMYYISGKELYDAGLAHYLVDWPGIEPLNRAGHQ